MEGHTDSRGSDELNQRLSDHRAEAVKNYLVSRGVPEDRVTPSAWAAKTRWPPTARPRSADNRRVDIVMQETQNPNG